MSTKEAIEEALAIGESLPAICTYSIQVQRLPGLDATVKLSMQASTQAEARVLRRLCYVRKWAKRRVDSCGWWEYTAKTDGLFLQIYAVMEAPPTCRLVEEEYEEVERVPVKFEERTVTRTRAKWQCSPAEGQP